jgi:hypothetical protein
MELTTRKTLKALAAVHGDETLVPTGKPVLQQNAPDCTTSEQIDSKTVPPIRTPAEELTPQQMKVVGLLISGRTYSQAAAEVGVDRSTVYRWRHEPNFEQEVRDRMDESLDAVAMRTCSYMLRSTELIASAMQSFDEKHTANVAFKLLNSKRAWDIASAGGSPKKEG